jgi:hypothetical protein
VRVLTRKVMRPTDAEIRNNPMARSTRCEPWRSCDGRQAKMWPAGRQDSVPGAQTATGNRKRVPPRQKADRVVDRFDAAVFRRSPVLCLVPGSMRQCRLWDRPRDPAAPGIAQGAQHAEIELARLKSPERIETIARTRLGLVMPDAQQTVILR